MAEPDHFLGNGDGSGGVDYLADGFLPRIVEAPGAGHDRSVGRVQRRAANVANDRFPGRHQFHPSETSMAGSEMTGVSVLRFPGASCVFIATLIVQRPIYRFLRIDTYF
jgi:hypothetical protein